MKVPIKKEMKKLEMFLVGTPRQFYVEQGETFCVRDGCNGCPYVGECEFEEAEVQKDPSPHARRGVGYEERSFLVLAFKPGVKVSDISEELIDPLYLKNGLVECEIYYFLMDQKDLFRVFKGQIRYFGTKEEFQITPYAEFFEVVGGYDPIHGIVSFDFSAIEPRVLTLASREPEYLKVFRGSLKEYARQIAIDSEVRPDSVFEVDGVLYCALRGELNKEGTCFKNRCEKCPVVGVCETIQPFYINVAGDWHAINAVAFFGDAFVKAEGKEWKEFRDKAKKGGLALTYGGSEYTLAKHFEIEVDAGLKIKEAFFRKLARLNAYMISCITKVMGSGSVVNLFGRLRDMSRYVTKEGKTRKQYNKEVGYAKRTCLNGPIQSSAAELLKIAMIRLDEYITEKELSPYQGRALPRIMTATYRDVKFHQIKSDHDEVVTVLRDDLRNEIIPPVFDVLQVKDVVDAFDVGFDLMLDVEYDKTRSWSAQEQYPVARILLLNNLNSGGSVQGQVAPNVFLVDIQHITPEILGRIAKAEGPEHEGFKMTVRQQDGLYLLNRSVSLEFIQALGIPYQLAVIEPVSS